MAKVIVRRRSDVVLAEPGAGLGSAPWGVVEVTGSARQHHDPDEVPMAPKRSALASPARSLGSP